MSEQIPRKPRIEYPGSIYHVMSRANGKGVIFQTDVDRQDFVKTLAEPKEPEAGGSTLLGYAV